METVKNKLLKDNEILQIRLSINWDGEESELSNPEMFR